MTSFTVKRTISMRVMTMSCKGEVVPITTPKEIRTDAEAKSLKSILKFFKEYFREKVVVCEFFSCTKTR